MCKEKIPHIYEKNSLKCYILYLDALINCSFCNDCISQVGNISRDCIFQTVYFNRVYSNNNNNNTKAKSADWFDDAN